MSWAAFRASAANLLPGDKRLFSEAPVPQPARPSEMSRQLKSRTRQARGPTAAAQPQPTMWFFRPSTSTLDKHSETVILFRQHCGPIVTFSRPADRRRRRARHRGAAGARKRGGPRYSIRMLGTGQTLRSHRGNDAGCLVIHSKSATADIPSQASLRTILTMMRPRERPQESSSIWREISRTDCHQIPVGK